MAEKGSYYFKPRKQSKGGGRFWRTLLRTADVIVWTASIVVTLLLIVAMVARYINPAEGGSLVALVALVFPVLFVCEIIVALYWIVRWKWMAIAVGCFVLLCLPDARLFYKPDFRKHYDNTIVPKEGLIVMSYNVMGFGYSGTGFIKLQSTASQIARHINQNKVDILCAQEFLVKENFTDRYFDEHLAELKNHYNLSYSNAGAEGIGLAIYSRYPIIESGVVNMAGDHRRSIWCDIRVGNDTLRVFSNHLQNTNITTSDQDYMERSIFNDQSVGFGRLKNIASRLRESYRLRAPQADSVALAIRTSPHPVIVCGDFNDTPLSYAYHRIAKGLKDSYVAKGAGAMGTYHGFFNMFRIDYILYSKTLRATRFDVLDDVELSDHNPIITELVVNY